MSTGDRVNKATTFRVLVVDDEETIRGLVRSRLERRGHEVEVAANGDEALEAARRFDPSVVVTDIRMPGKDGFAVLRELDVPTVLITGHGDKESAIRAVEEGAFAFFEKPFDLDALEVAIRRAGERRLMELERTQLLQRLDRLCRLQDRELEAVAKGDSEHFVGTSPALVEIKATLARLAMKPLASLLIQGETGTGKEVVARELHRLSHPGQGHVPFIPVNCSAIPAELLESELYGHEKGSFSGAHSQRVGLAEAVREGTLFLDEFGDLDARHQAKLLRLLQERSFRRVGSNKEIPFQGRIVAATHRDLATRIETGEFREDLYYRISVVTVTLPPLRERGPDLVTLAESLCRKHGLRGLAPALRGLLGSYPWPGNVRELGNWVERASILGQHDEQMYVTAALPGGRPSVSAIPNALGGQAAGLVSSLKDRRAQALDEVDRQMIQKALDDNDGNVSAAARDLQMDRKNLARRMKELGLTGKREAA